MATVDSVKTRLWTEAWLQSVADGAGAMSQRKLSSVNRLGGGVEMAKSIAREKGVHLLITEDERGAELVAASVRPFKVVC